MDTEMEDDSNHSLGDDLKDMKFKTGNSCVQSRSGLTQFHAKSTQEKIIDDVFFYLLGMF